MADELHAAVALGLTARVQQLLEARAAGVNSQNQLGQTPLYVACRDGRLPEARILLTAGADTGLATEEPGKQRCGETPLIVASRGGHIAVVQTLLDGCAHVNLAKVSGNVTPLFIAAQEGHVAVVRELLTRGAIVNLASRTGTTPLSIAANKVGACVRELTVGGC